MNSLFDSEQFEEKNRTAYIVRWQVHEIIKTTKNITRICVQIEVNIKEPFRGTTFLARSIVYLDVINLDHRTIKKPNLHIIWWVRECIEKAKYLTGHS